ncbi:MAG: hypothetical protein H7Z13_05595 [Ferruginibacter sp.]|nr:hypothetical protein [Ferruginibacter sp.]
MYVSDSAKAGITKTGMSGRIVALKTVDSPKHKPVKRCFAMCEVVLLQMAIERFHYVLKSRTKIEEVQLEKASSLQKAIPVYSIAAMRIMQLVYQSRERFNVSCEVLLTSVCKKTL